jgi:hypothetical protein
MRVTFAYEPHQPLGRQAFLSTKFGLPLVEDGVVAACVIDEPLGPDLVAELDCSPLTLNRQTPLSWRSERRGFGRSSPRVCRVDVDDDVVQ